MSAREVRLCLRKRRERARLDLCSAPQLIHSSAAARSQQPIFMDISLHSGSFWEFRRNILMDVADRSPLNGSGAGNESKNQSKRFDQSELCDSRSPESGQWLLPRCTFTEPNSLKRAGFHPAEQKPFGFLGGVFPADTWPRFTRVPGSVAQPPPRSPTLLRVCGMIILYLEITDSV